MKQGTSAALSPWMPAVLLTAFLLHNLEEALTYPVYREQAQALVQQLFSITATFPTAGAFHGALILVSLTALCAMGWAVVHPARRSALLLVKALAWVMLLNVIIPHVPAALLLGGYSPGVITAIVLNLPIAAYVLFRTNQLAS